MRVALIIVAAVFIAIGCVVSLVGVTAVLDPPTDIPPSRWESAAMTGAGCALIGAGVFLVAKSRRRYSI